MVETAVGMIERDRLTVKDFVTEGENHRTIATEWYLDGQMVKRDCHVVILRTQAIGGEQAHL